MRKILAFFVVLPLVLACLGVVWIYTPVREHQPRRWYTMPIEALRADLFADWGVIQPQAEIPSSSSPRIYERDLIDPATVTYEFDGERRTVADYIERANVSGLMLLRDGKVRIEVYRKGLDRESRSHIWSASKSFTATLIGMAVYDGKIQSLDDPVEVYAPQFVGTAYGEASIRHVMMMSSGIDFHHFEGSPNRDDLYDAVLQRGEDFDRWAAALGRRTAPGTDFNYIATDTHVLSAVLRGAYGKPFAEVVEEKLWEPGGFGAARWGLDASGHAMGHCCLSLRLQDFANLGQLYLEDLELGGEPVVGPDWIAAVEQAQAPFQEPVVSPEASRRSGYSFQFWLPPAYDREFIAMGAFGQYLWIDRERGFVVAQFSTGASLRQMLTSGGASSTAVSEEETFAVMRALGGVG